MQVLLVGPDISRRLCWHLHSEPHSAICPSLLGIHQLFMRCLAPSLPPWPLGQHVDPGVTPSPAIGCPLCWVALLPGPQPHTWWHLSPADGVTVRGLCWLLFLRMMMRSPGQVSTLPASQCLLTQGCSGGPGAGSESIKGVVCFCVSRRTCSGVLDHSGRPLSSASITNSALCPSQRVSMPTT